MRIRFHLLYNPVCERRRQRDPHAEAAIMQAATQPCSSSLRRFLLGVAAALRADALRSSVVETVHPAFGQDLPAPACPEGPTESRAAVPGTLVRRFRWRERKDRLDRVRNLPRLGRSACMGSSAQLGPIHLSHIDDIMLGGLLDIGEGQCPIFI